MSWGEGNFPSVKSVLHWQLRDLLSGHSSGPMSTPESQLSACGGVDA